MKLETWALEVKLVRVNAEVDRHGATVAGTKPRTKTVRECYYGSFERHTETDAVGKYRKVMDFIECLNPQPVADYKTRAAGERDGE